MEHYEQDNKLVRTVVRERAVWMVLYGTGPHESRWAAIVSFVSKIGCAPQLLNECAKKVEVDTGRRGGITTEQAKKMKALEREVRELTEANNILCKSSAYFAPSLAYAAVWREGSSSYWATMHERGVLPIEPATFYDHLAKRADPSRLSERDMLDEELKPGIESVFEKNLMTYGVRKVWHHPLATLLCDAPPGN